MFKRVLAGLALSAIVVWGSATGAQAGTAGATIEASPASISTGATSTITASGLGGLETAFFGLGDTSGVALVSAPGGTPDTIAQVAASGGRATANFTASQPGSYTVVVGDGETVIATTTVTVTAGSQPPAQTVEVSVDPGSVEVGGTVTVTATGLGGLEEAGFGLADTSAGVFASGSSSIEVPVSNGTATTTFTPRTAGSITIAVGDGETSVGQTTLTVTAAASPSPTASRSASPTPSTSPDPAPAVEGFPALAVWLIVAGVLLLAAIIVIVVMVVRRRQSRSGGTPPAP